MIVNAFKYGFYTGLKQWKIALIVFSIQLGLALTLGLQVMNVIESSIGKSLEMNKLLKGYDHTVFSDFIEVHGGSISPLIGQLRWLILIYLLFAVFIDGGLLFCASKQEKIKGEMFWQGGATHYFSFLKIAFFFVLIALFWSALLFLPTAMLFQPALAFFPNEKYAIYGFLLLLLIYFIGLNALFLWSVLSRFYKIKTGSPLFVCVKKGIEIFRKNSLRVWALTGIFLGIQLCMIVLYWNLSTILGSTSPILILITVLIQQIFVFCRVSLRQMLYSALSRIDF